MTPQQLDLIPDSLLTAERDGCRRLIDWLHGRGWRMTLHELETERRRRGVRRNR
jgi:hypothetical protein